MEIKVNNIGNKYIEVKIIGDNAQIESGLMDDEERHAFLIGLLDAASEICTDDVMSGKIGRLSAEVQGDL